MDRTLRIALCDDNKYIMNQLKQMIAQQLDTRQCSCEISTFDKPYDLLNTNQPYDLLFLDIEMPGMNGLALSRLMAEKQQDAKTIFVTSHPEYVREGYKVNAYRYLYKPLDSRDIQEVLTSYLKTFSRQNGISLSTRYETVYLPLNQIAYIEALGDGSAVHLLSRTMITSKSLSAILTLLDERFFLCHRSCIVNFDLISSIDFPHNLIRLNTGENLPISLRKKKLLKENYFKYMQGNARYL